jgi:hypothetical protein
VAAVPRLEPLAVFRPAEELREAVESIVEAPARNGQDLGLEFVEPGPAQPLLWRPGMISARSL